MRLSLQVLRDRSWQWYILSFRVFTSSQITRFDHLQEWVWLLEARRLLWHKRWAIPQFLPSSSFWHLGMTPVPLVSMWHHSRCSIEHGHCHHCTSWNVWASRGDVPNQNGSAKALKAGGVEFASKAPVWDTKTPFVSRPWGRLNYLLYTATGSL